MTKTLITLACALAAPLAFAQTSTTTTETTATQPTTSTSTSETTTTSSATKPTTGTTTTETTTTTTSTEGTVTSFVPGKTIVVRRVGVVDPITYTLGKTVQFVNRAGRTIEASLVKPGVPVHVYYDNAGGTQTVTRVVVDQD